MNWSKQSLEANLDVYVEKPTSRSLEETRELAELADLKNKILMTAFNRRFSPTTQRVKQLAEEHNFTFAHLPEKPPQILFTRF